MAQAQVVVAPRRPSQTHVRWFDFDWHHVDILIGPAASGEEADEGGARMHYRLDGEGPFGPGQGGGWNWAAGRLARRAPGGFQAAGPGLSAPFLAESAPGARATGPTGAQDAGVDKLTSAIRNQGEAALQTPAWTGGVRLFFYEQARPVARWAAGFIEQTYRELVQDFNYVPRKTFSYFLYSSYLEFMQTNLFPIQEGVLGVTSPQNLNVTLPYLGDHALFRDISKHELAHEFTIQKVETYAKANNAAQNPLMKIPLWFIEGLAEYYAKGGLDPQTEVLVRDLIVNPDAGTGYVLDDFFDDRRRGFLWTYKLGQARCAFLQETYGEDTLQRVLEQAFRLVGDKDGNNQVGDFPEYLAWITGESRQTTSRRFERWVKQRHFESYLGAHQTDSALKVYEGGKDFIQALSVAPGGELLLYRSISMQTGQRSLYLTDYRAPGNTVVVASDGNPEVETLHPVAGRNFDLHARSLAFVAQQEERDVIYWQRYTHTVKWGKKQKPGAVGIPPVLTKNEPAQPADAPRVYAAESESSPPGESPAGGKNKGGGAADTRQQTPSGEAQAGQKLRVEDVDLNLGERVKYRLAAWDIVGVNTLALAPDGRRIVFVGLTEKGQTDLFLVVPDDDHTQFAVERLTDDVYAEREVSWGPGGIIYTSDATEGGHYNLFKIDPEDKEITRLTFEERDQTSPRMLDDGRIFFVAYDGAGANIYELTAGGIQQKTALPSALSDLGPAPDGGLWALQYYQGRQRPLRIPKGQFLTETIASRAVQAVDATAYPVPSTPLSHATPYDVWSLDNWKLGNIFALAGASTGGIAGQVFASASDKLQDHALIFSLSAYGGFDSVDGSLFYLNQSNRVVWGAGAFQDVGYRLDRTFEGDREIPDFISSERFFGVSGTARYPFDRFTFVQGALAVGGLDYFLFDRTEACLNKASCVGRPGVLDAWEAANSDVRFQAEPSVSLGYNTLRYHPHTGPFMGHSVLATGSYDWQPFHQNGFSTLRLDAEQYWSIWGRTNFLVRAGTGYSFGSRFARSFYLSSFDTLRGVPYGSFAFLLGRAFFFGTAEIQFPLNFLVRVPFVDIEGVVGADFGAAADSYMAAWDRRVLDAAAGVNFGLGPFVFRLHFAKPFDIGALAVPNQGNWTTNFSLTYRYY